MYGAQRIAGGLVTALVGGSLFVGSAWADDKGNPPVHESVRSSTMRDDVPPDAVVSLLAVRRVENHTVVYFSAGLLTAAGKPLASYLGDQTVTTGMVFRTVSSEAMVVDPTTHTTYTPLTKDGEGCVACSDADHGAWAISLQTGVSYVGYVVLPALPAATTRVEVFAANRIFENVPVGDGALTPIATPTSDGVVALGSGWPAVNLDNVSTASDPPVYSIHRSTTNVQQGDVTTREAAQQKSYDLSARVLFDKDSAVLKPAAMGVIRSVAAQIKNTAAPVQVAGYTDNLGSHEHGVVLSTARAKAVAAVLKPLLPAGTTITTDGFAEANPVASNDTEAGRQQNRRVTISVKAG